VASFSGRRGKLTLAATDMEISIRRAPGEVSETPPYVREA
jgi:hypothetical protein